jgi:hypothetical protein
MLQRNSSMNGVFGSVIKFFTLALGLSFQSTWSAVPPSAPLPPVELYAPSSCPPCAGWIQQLRQRGFVVTQEEKSADGMRRIKHWVNVPSALESVQTARVGGYFIEGSVPVEDILRLLKEKPMARGLALSVLPGGGLALEKYNTVFVGADGQTSIYVRH